MSFVFTTTKFIKYFNFNLLAFQLSTPTINSKLTYQLSDSLILTERESHVNINTVLRGNAND
jgi:hypothetical protein